MRIVKGFAWLALTCAALGACGWIVGIHDRQLETAEGGMPEAAPIDPCTLDGVPERSQATSSPNDNIDFVAALNSVALGLDPEAGAPSNYGFNLDKTCSCPDSDPKEPSSCVPRAGDQNLCDLDNGIDLGGRKIFAYAATLIQESEINAGLQQGTWGSLMRIQQWNGTPDDSFVSVSIYTSLGLEGDGGVKGDGTDRWTVDMNSINGSVDQPKVTADAFVVNGKLVARLLSFPLAVESKTRYTVFINLTAAVLVASIERSDGGAHRLSGILAGRWKASDALPALQVFKDPYQKNAYLCGDSGTYQNVKSFLCLNLDINHSPDSNPRDPCDSSSIGLHFTATESKLGTIVPHSEPEGGCGPNWSDSCPQ